MNEARKKVLITGAAGRVGSVLSRALKDDYDLILVDVEPLEELEGVQRHCADVRDVSAMEALCVGVHTVIHLAIGGNIWDLREQLESVNIQGAHGVMRAAAKAGCLRIIFASSITIEWFLAQGKDNDYAQAKKEVEQWAEELSKTEPISILCLRLGNVLSSTHPAIWPGRENLSFVLTHRDAIQLFRSALCVPMELHYGVFACVSRNEPLAFDIDPACEALGFDPCDDAYILARQNARSLKGRLRTLKRLAKHMLKAMLKS